MRREQLGLMSAIVPGMTGEQVADLTVAAGGKNVEACAWPAGSGVERRYSGVTHLHVVDGMTPGEAQDEVGKMTSAGVNVSSVAYYPNVMSADPDEAEAAKAWLRTLIEFADVSGVGMVTTFVGRRPDLDDYTNWLLFQAIWPDLVKFAADHGVTIGIENCPMYFTRDQWPGGLNLASTPAAWDRMFNIVDSVNFGLNFDPAHLVWQMIDIIAAIRKYGVKFVHAHLKAVVLNAALLATVGIRAHPLEYHTPVLPGPEDGMDWPGIFAAFDEVGYGGVAVLEVEDKRYEDTVAHRVEAVHSGLNYLAQFCVDAPRPACMPTDGDCCDPKCIVHGQ